MAARRTLHDRFFKLAKAEGYAARSAYKLKQIHERRGLIQPGDLVLDLGCAPGSWLQVAGELAGPHGRVLGLDLQPVSADLPPNARAVVGDVFTATAPELLAAAGLTDRHAPRDRFDVVLSDMAPSTTGAGDHFKSVELCRRVLDLLPRLLAVGGRLAMKVFEGESYPELLKETAAVFMDAKGFKPEATRAVSVEMFIIGFGYRGRTLNPHGSAPPPEDRPGAWTAARLPPHKRAALQATPSTAPTTAAKASVQNVPGASAKPAAPAPAPKSRPAPKAAPGPKAPPRRKPSRRPAP